MPGRTALIKVASPHSYLLSRLVFVVVAMLVPLFVVQALEMLRDEKSAEDAAFNALAARAHRAASGLDGALGRAEQLLTFLSSRDELKSLDARRCNELLRGVLDLGQAYAGVVLADTSGQLVCSSHEGSAPWPWADADGFRKGMAADGVLFSGPRPGPLPGKQVAVLTLAVRARGGEKVGLLAAAIDLPRLSELLAWDDLPPQSTLAVVTGDSVFLTRSPSPGAWIGQPVPEDIQRKPAGPDRDIVFADGADGLARVFASVAFPKYDLRVVAGMPVERLYADARQELVHSALQAGLVACMGLLAAYFATRKLIAPLNSIAVTTRQLASGNAGVRADESLPGEFGEIAAEFNRLMDRQEEGAGKLRQSEKHALRVSNFYEALSSTNQAIVRLREPQALFEEICHICVRTRLADMAWIGIVQGERMRPVAWGGRAREYTQGLEIDLRDVPDAPEGPTSRAVRLNAPVIVNSYLGDPSTEPWRERAARFDVRASAAFPFMKDDAVAGALNLYVGEEHYFNEELVALLENMMRDISFALEAHEREAARAAAEHALKARELQMSGIIESVADAIVTVDAHDRIVVFNRAAGELFGVAPAAALGQAISTYVPQGLAGSVATPPSATGVVHASRHLAGVRGDGTRCSLKATVSIRHEGPNLLVTAVLRDETRLQQAERARAAIIEAETASRAKTAFLSMVSHELRTPLNAILGFTQMLQRHSRDKLDEQGRQQLDHVFLAGTQLRALIEDVLDVSKIEAGQLALNLKDVDLHRLLDGVLKMSEPLAAANGVALIADFARAEPLRLNTDPVRVRQILLNLVSNAIKYNKPGGRVFLGFGRVRDRVALRVVDNGMGMSRSQLANLFQLFNRLGREGSAIEGSGIGLNLTRQLVEFLGGTLDISSEEGVGTEVTVLLPYVEATSPPTVFGELAPGAGTAGTPATGAPRGVVLYVEDNPVNALLVEQLLSTWPDVQVVVAPTGMQGLVRAAQLRPDVILLDMQLPDMSGLEVLARLRADRATHDLRVVALSANAMPADVQAAQTAGAEDYWTKPIDFAQVLQGLEEMLRR